MENTTIAISNEIKDQIKEFGNKGETYEQILERIYNLAFRENLNRFMMSSEGFIPIEEARKRLDKKWPRSK